MQTFPTGYRLRKDDLNIQFVKKIGFRYGPLANYDPFYVAYEIGTVATDLTYTRIGPDARRPELVKIGTYRANFIIGDNWTVGDYRIIWKYQTCQTDPIQLSTEDFEVSASYSVGNSLGLTVTMP